MYSSDRMRRNEILLIFFRHYIERLAKTVIGLLLRHQQRLREIAKNDKSTLHGRQIQRPDRQTTLENTGIACNIEINSLILINVLERVNLVLLFSIRVHKFNDNQKKVKTRTITIWAIVKCFFRPKRNSISFNGPVIASKYPMFNQFIAIWSYRSFT